MIDHTVRILLGPRLLYPGSMIGGDPGSATLENPNRRVKVYVLGSDGQWDDRGTGYVKCEIIPVRLLRTFLALQVHNGPYKFF